MDQALFNDKRTVLTLDAGGTNFVFSALRAGKEIVEPVRKPSHGENLERCIASMKEGFRDVQQLLDDQAVAISFAFPGPADYPHGIIGDLANLPGFQGGVPLGPILEDTFQVPVFINNDGDLFTYGEALGGFLPEINRMLEENGNPRQYKNLVGLTLGTGFGAGIYINGHLMVGDNSVGAEVWLLSTRHSPDRSAEEAVSIRSVIRNYAKYTGDANVLDITPKDIFDIADGQQSGSREAALSAYKEMGTHLGDAMANLITLTDGVIVLGGGITGAARYFMPSAMKTLNGQFEFPEENPEIRLIQKAYYLDDEKYQKAFVEKSGREIKVPGTGRSVYYDDHPKTAIGISRLGTSRAISLGAYALAIHNLNSL
jgi:glucokinase